MAPVSFLVLALTVAAHASLVSAQVKVTATGFVEQYPSEEVDYDFFLDPVTVTGSPTPVGEAARWWLMFQKPSDKQKLLAGYFIRATGFNFGSRMFVTDLEVLSATPPQDFKYGSNNVAITSITLLVSICGRRAAPNATSVTRIWTREGATAAGSDPNLTLEALYNECTWGKVSFSQDDNIVVDLQGFSPPSSISSAIPCSGNTMTCSGMVSQLQGGPCATLRQMWLNWALNTAASVYGINVTRFDRRVLVIPGLDVFGVSGMAQIGAGVGVTTNAFLRGEYVLYTLRCPFHELGHNYGLQHSWGDLGRGAVDYGDLSCVMGSVVQGGAQPKCFSAPQAWYAGWAEPVAELNGTTFPAGKWQVVWLPRYLSNKVNFFRVVPTWLGTTTPTYFFSYRAPIGRDALLDARYLNSISVHQYTGTRAGLSAAYPTLITNIAKGTSFIIQALGYKVQFHSLSSNGLNARVHVCRMTASTETNCNDGLDDDCNGLVDSKDPACMSRRPPPSPLSG